MDCTQIPVNRPTKLKFQPFIVFNLNTTDDYNLITTVKEINVLIKTKVDDPCQVIDFRSSESTRYNPKTHSHRVFVSVIDHVNLLKPSILLN